MFIKKEQPSREPREPKEFTETLVQLNRVSKKTKGGNHMRMAALVVVGDKKGRVGAGLAKALDVRSAVQKAVLTAKRNLIVVPMRVNTIPYRVEFKYGAARIILMPAPAGSGIIAGGAVRTILEAAGIHDASAKILGTKNKITNVYATLGALEKLSEMKETRRVRAL
jgi:small subunit ribosomal protein S5